jgi:hypothetical protein
MTMFVGEGRDPSVRGFAGALSTEVDSFVGWFVDVTGPEQTGMTVPEEIAGVDHTMKRDVYVVGYFQLEVGQAFDGRERGRRL